MAVVQNPITGRSKNAFAGGVFSTWKGKNVLRSKPLTVANPRTEAQLLQREKLSQGVELYRQFPGEIQVGFAQQAVGMSEYNAFMSGLLKDSFTGSTPSTVLLDVEEILISKGTMQQTPIDSAGYSTPDVDITWDESAPLGPGQASSDLAYAAVISQDSTTGEIKAFIQAAPVARTVGTITVPAISGLDSTNFAAYLFFVSTVNDSVSDSVVEIPA